jgi:hypothetical protein
MSIKCYNFKTDHLMLKESIMTSKFLKLLFVMAVSSGLLSNANASLILTEGDLVADANGVDWEYVGKFKISDGPFYDDADDRCINGPSDCVGLFAPAINGVEAAELIFGTLTSGQYAISTLETVVNRLAYYDVRKGAITALSESITDDSNVDGLYNEEGDISAYVNDRSMIEINYVFKSIEVPVNSPSTFVIFLLAMFGLGLQRFRV